MVVCKFFLQGTCRYGDNCRNEHPRNERSGFSSQNRFAAFQNPGSSGGGGTISRRDVPYGINIEDVKNDLTDGKGRPKWILSTYGPGRSPPASLLEGNEYSSEEIRVRFYEMRANGKIDEANQEASSLWAKAEQAMADVINNASNVVKFMEDAEKKHPNRLDFTKLDGPNSRDQIVKEAEAGNNSGGSSGFGQPSAFTNPSTAFGQPTPSSGFGSGGFGQPAQPSSFGKPSGPFGQPTASTFGKPSIGFGQPSFGQSTQPGFGQPAQPATVFGRPALQAPVFGQPAKPAPAFGQPSQPAPVFGQATQAPSAFGKPAFGSSGFGQPSTGFGQPSFSQPAQSTVPFGQPSQPAPTFGQSSQPNSGFGQSTQSSTGFGQPTKPSPFGQISQPSPFSQHTSISSPFGQATATTGSESTATLAFGKLSTEPPTFGQSPPQQSNPFGTRPEDKTANVENTMSSSIFPPGSGASSMNPNPADQGSKLKSSMSEIAVLPPNNNSSATPHPLTNKAPRPLHYTQTLSASSPTATDPATKQLRTYRGQPVRYINDSPCYQRPDGRGWERIWFPHDGQTPDVVYLGREGKTGDLVAEQKRYTDEVIQEFAFLFEMGKFKDGKMPAVPPKREWCLYDF